MKRKIMGLLLVCVMIINLSGCKKVYAADLMSGVKANSVSSKALDETFINSQMRLALELFKSSAKESENKNVLISPLSIQLALSMTANGAVGQTKMEMEKLLGGEISIEELNQYLYSYVKSLPSEEKSKLEIANSIWWRDTEDILTVEKDFLQTNADYYGADAYKAPFDGQTVKDINDWVKEKTDGMIDSIVDEIDKFTMMYLINALVFDAEWENVYTKSDIRDGTFSSISGKKSVVPMMNSEEYKYLDDGKSVGFIKDYKDGKHSFAALLPNEDIGIYNYIKGQTTEGLLEILNNAKEELVKATMPKFSYEYEIGMSGILKALGIPTAFDESLADFSKMGKLSSKDDNLYIGDVLHKTFISVDELGTKAGAVTSVEVDRMGMAKPNYVKLDRPFVYMIIDNATSLPIFIGAVMDI